MHGGGVLTFKRSSKHNHIKLMSSFCMLQAVLRAPLAFFTVTPIGRVLGAFSKDQDCVDESLQDTIHMTTIYFMILGTTSGVVLSVVPQFAAILGALIIASVIIFRYYIRASGALKHMTGAADAMLLAHVSESQQGMAVIQV
jgi:ATP-binding cassette, subfamily C (CFTR/MRP), member 1